jgi:hypothetical protein
MIKLRKFSDLMVYFKFILKHMSLPLEPALATSSLASPFQILSFLAQQQHLQDLPCADEPLPAVPQLLKGPCPLQQACPKNVHFPLLAGGCDDSAEKTVLLRMVGQAFCYRRDGNLAESGKSVFLQLPPLCRHKNLNV